MKYLFLVSVFCFLSSVSAFSAVVRCNSTTSSSSGDGGGSESIYSELLLNETIKKISFVNGNLNGSYDLTRFNNDLRSATINFEGESADGKHIAGNIKYLSPEGVQASLKGTSFGRTSFRCSNFTYKEN